MDTKWKNRKKGISFLIFFLGVTLTLGSIIEILSNKPSGVPVWRLDLLQEDDYQQSGSFRSYIADRLESFLIMAVGGEGLWDLNGYWGEFSEEYWEEYSQFQEATAAEDYAQEGETSDALPSLSEGELVSYLQGLIDLQDMYRNMLNDSLDPENPDKDQLNHWKEILNSYRDELNSYQETLNASLGSQRRKIKSLTEQQRQELAQKYHDSIKEDKNILYSIRYDGKTLYSNSDLLPEEDSISTADGCPILPEGYNFLLYFDGERARIFKDGQEIDVYKDGYYRDESDWYLPGYSNFQADDTVKKAAVYIAAAEKPVHFTKTFYENGKTKLYDNSLYWIYTNFQYRLNKLQKCLAVLAAGLLLLTASFFLRKSRREAARSIAGFQAKIWLECKVLLFLGLYYTLYMIFVFVITDSYGYSLWEEWIYTYEYSYTADSLVRFSQQVGSSLPFQFWIMLFWGLWLLWNDLKYNKKPWRCSLAARLSAAFSAKGLKQPLSRKMSRRNLGLLLGTALYGTLLTGIIILSGRHSREDFPVLLIPAIAATALFLALQFMAGKKNMADARDMEALSRRIARIRSGDYGEAQGDTEGHIPGRDLESVMEQLDDIRHGMANAVDEQMKSERMKVELIANVSHDIKTPLTSIISYVEFLKQEEGLPEHVRDYIKILDEKSQRLKNMVQDVFAVSKAASGELPIQMEALDFGKLLRQTLADMEEQIQSSPVTFRTDLPDTPVQIMADGQRLYRVFQNLFQNAIKYSLQGSRVYVTLKTDGCLAVASVKNTSLQEPDAEKDYTERFARGDSSRTDGGSGLGLSIAQSFTEACGGTFSWRTDADLFVVEVTFRVLQS